MGATSWELPYLKWLNKCLSTYLQCIKTICDVPSLSSLLQLLTSPPVPLRLVTAGVLRLAVIKRRIAHVKEYIHFKT